MLQSNSVTSAWNIKFALSVQLSVEPSSRSPGSKEPTNAPVLSGVRRTIKFWPDATGGVVSDVQSWTITWACKFKLNNEIRIVEINRLNVIFFMLRV